MDTQEYYRLSNYTRRLWGIVGQNNQGNRSAYNAVNETKLISCGKSLIHYPGRGEAIDGFLNTASPGQRNYKAIIVQQVPALPN